MKGIGHTPVLVFAARIILLAGAALLAMKLAVYALIFSRSGLERGLAQVRSDAPAILGLLAILVGMTLALRLFFKPHPKLGYMAKATRERTGNLDHTRK